MDIRLALTRMQAKRDHERGSQYAYAAAVRQFNGLLEAAKARYGGRPDIKALEAFPHPTITKSDELSDSVQRLIDALEGEPEGQRDSALMHQKFGILRAEPQLVADFDASNDLQGGVALLFFDVDHFKSLNTKYTESVVDQDILVPLQRMLLELVRERGFCYCVGGDEFIILLLNADPSESLAFAQRLLRGVQDRAFECAGESVSLTLSVGLASCPRDGTTLADVRGKANYAENRAKEQGRNRVVEYE